MKSNFRTAITVPEKCWSRFRDILTDYCDKMKTHGPIGSGGPGAITGGNSSITSSSGANNNSGNSNNGSTSAALINQGLADALLGVDIGGLLGNGSGGGSVGLIGQQPAVGTPAAASVGPIGSGIIGGGGGSSVVVGGGGSGLGGVLGDRGDALLTATAGGSGPHGGLK